MHLVSRHEVFARIDERIFKVLYSEETSRPNAPVNVMARAGILKADLAWSVLDLTDQMTFNIQVRMRCALDGLATKAPELRTIQNCRRTVQGHAEVNGTDFILEIYSR